MLSLEGKACCAGAIWDEDEFGDLVAAGGEEVVPKKAAMGLYPERVLLGGLLCAADLKERLE